MNKKNSNFGLLRNKNIIEILDGDKNFGEFETFSDRGNIVISLPYLSGPKLCDISTQFGLPVSYPRSGGAKSRWEYLDNLLEFCIENDKISELLNYLFSKKQFVGTLRGYTVDEIDSAYSIIISTVINQINGILYFSNYELVKTDTVFSIVKKGETISISAPSIKVIDRSYISDLSGRALKDVADGNFDSAITKSRTLLEEVFCYVIEKKNEVPTDSGDIGRLYNQVKSLYNMHQSKDTDKRINGLLSGLEKIVNAIAEMRNKGSDSHGVGVRRISIEDHHARLLVNSSIAMADFVLSVGEKH